MLVVSSLLSHMRFLPTAFAPASMHPSYNALTSLLFPTSTESATAARPHHAHPSHAHAHEMLWVCRLTSTESDPGATAVNTPFLNEQNAMTLLQSRHPSVFAAGTVYVCLLCS